MLSQIFFIIFPLFAIAGVGYAYGRWKRPDMTLPNQLNMDVFVPALVLHALADRTFDVASYATLAAGVFLVILTVGVVAAPLARLAGVAPRTFAPPMMFKNAGNMGLPLAVLAFGERALPAAVIIYLVSSVLHFSVGNYIMSRRARLTWLLRMPLLHAAALGLVLSFAGVSLPEPIAVPVDMLGRISIPLLLFSLGVRLNDIDLRDWRVGLFGACLCPVAGVALAALALLVLEMPAEQERHFLVFGALPPAVFNYILAEANRREPTKMASIVLMGNLVSLVSLPLVLAWVLR